MLLCWLAIVILAGCWYAVIRIANCLIWLLGWLAVVRLAVGRLAGCCQDGWLMLCWLADVRLSLGWLTV